MARRRRESAGARGMSVPSSGFVIGATLFFPELVIAFVFAAVLGGPLIAFLKRLAYRQHAYEDAPETHQKKTGTPTMGGLLFLVAPIVALAYSAVMMPNAVNWPVALLVIAAGAVGFVDDYSAIRLGRNRGLGARSKFLATALIGAAFLGGILLAEPHGIEVVFLGHLPVWAWFLLSLAAILATMHAVNLTDGLDGLASGTILPPLAVFAWLGVFGSATMATGFAGTLLAVALMGAVCGFLIYNRHPAKMFMGDTGSLALGAGLAGVAILTGGQLLLLLVGGVFVAETLSVMIQVASYKTRKKRVFRMSPLHHHFELGGWPETKVTASFWAASLVLSIIGFVIVVKA
jgi:phospho-N-acetylmuramoyl-pentapeptide-transferase